MIHYLNETSATCYKGFNVVYSHNTNVFSKCDQIGRKLQIWSHLLETSLMKNFTLCAVSFIYFIESSGQVTLEVTCQTMLHNSICWLLILITTVTLLSIWLIYLNRHQGSSHILKHISVWQNLVIQLLPSLR